MNSNGEQIVCNVFLIGSLIKLFRITVACTAVVGISLL